MKKSESKERQAARRRLTRMVQRLRQAQKEALLPLAGIGASGLTDISEAHDTYLHQKP